jgi:hypothetical protein
MAIVNYANREIQLKIVYYGPALCGKLPISALFGAVATGGMNIFSTLDSVIQLLLQKFTREKQAFGPTSTSLKS